EADYRTASGRIGVATRKSEEIDKMKGQIDELAERAGISLDAIDHRPPNEALFYDEYFVEIGKFETDMQNLLKFFESIENLAAPGMMRVSKLNITPSKTKGAVRGSMVISKLMTSSGIEEE
ncbi:MAG: hypothetical protein JXN60_08225, partial [Lentisphaerae bacterium]|nr:hypothetical protein [Lentisphaerota bacterium]